MWIVPYADSDAHQAFLTHEALSEIARITIENVRRFVSQQDCLSEWHLGDVTSSHLSIAEAISLAKEPKDIPALTNALFNSGNLSYYERDSSKAERFASEAMELSTRTILYFFWLQDPYSAVGLRAPWAEERRASSLLRMEYKTIWRLVQ